MTHIGRMAAWRQPRPGGLSVKRSRIMILGAAGLGRAFYGALASQGAAKTVVGFLDDGPQEAFCGLPILGRCRDLPDLVRRHRISHVALGVGYRFFEERQEMIALINESDCEWASAVHASAIVNPDVRLGRGVFIGAGSIVNAGTRIGDHGVLWSGVILEHDNEIDDDVYIATGVMTAGYVKIQSHAFIGMGSMIAKCTIGEYATIGTGSLVLHDVPARTYAWGRPARTIKRKPQLAYV